MVEAVVLKNYKKSVISKVRIFKKVVALLSNARIKIVTILL